MSEWLEVEIGELGRVVTGKTPPTSEEKYFNGGFKFVSPKDMDFDSRYINSTLTSISSEALAKFKNQVIPKNTVMFTALSYGFGKIGLSAESCLTNQQINSIVVDESRYDFNFVYYLLRNSKDYLLSFDSGIVTPIINKTTFEKIKVLVPKSKNTQKKIAKILSNYDDYIENNLKRIKLLEESARLIYEEWFLRFRIDGKKLEVDLNTGLPFGWRKIKVDDYTKLVSKGPSLNYDLGESKGVEVLNQSCVRNGEIELQRVLIAKDLKDDKKSSYLRINDILINSLGDGTVGRVSKNVSIDSKMIIHNCITYLRAKNIYSQYMLFYFISAHQEYFELLAQGSTGQTSLKSDLVSDLIITLPDDNIMNRFDSITSAMWSEVGVLKKKNKLLKEARDILLPRLMTGMIDTDELDTAI